VVVLEIMPAAAVSDADVRHRHWLAGRLGDRLADAVVITTGSHGYRTECGGC
jgi:uncharacterized protein